MKDSIVAYPERLTGLWEARTGSGDTVGLQIAMITTIAGAATSLSNVIQHREHVTFGIYLRHGADLQTGDENYFDDSPGDGTRWDGSHLVLRPTPRAREKFSIDVDLIRDEKRNTWAGLFHRGNFSENVTLQRPKPESKAKVSPLVGTWAAGDMLSAMNDCMHIVQQPDGALEGWVDSLGTSGLNHYANGIKPPSQSSEYYGDRLRVQQIKDRLFLIEFGAYSAICCSHSLAVALSPDNTRLEVGRHPNAAQNLRVPAWTKVHGDSCRPFPQHRLTASLQPSRAPRRVVQR